MHSELPPPVFCLGANLHNSLVDDWIMLNEADKTLHMIEEGEECSDGCSTRSCSSRAKSSASSRGPLEVFCNDSSESSSQVTTEDSFEMAQDNALDDFPSLRSTLSFCESFSSSLEAAGVDPAEFLGGNQASGKSISSSNGKGRKKSKVLCMQTGKKVLNEQAVQKVNNGESQPSSSAPNRKSLSLPAARDTALRQQSTDAQKAPVWKGSGATKTIFTSRYEWMPEHGGKNADGSEDTADRIPASGQRPKLPPYVLALLVRIPVQKPMSEKPALFKHNLRNLMKGCKLQYNAFHHDMRVKRALSPPSSPMEGAWAGLDMDLLEQAEQDALEEQHDSIFDSPQNSFEEEVDCVDEQLQSLQAHRGVFCDRPIMPQISDVANMIEDTSVMIGNEMALGVVISPGLFTSRGPHPTGVVATGSYSEHAHAQGPLEVRRLSPARAPDSVKATTAPSIDTTAPTSASHVKSDSRNSLMSIRRMASTTPASLVQGKPGGKNNTNILSGLYPDDGIVADLKAIGLFNRTSAPCILDEGQVHDRAGSASMTACRASAMASVSAGPALKPDKSELWCVGQGSVGAGSRMSVIRPAVAATDAWYSGDEFANPGADGIVIASRPLSINANNPGSRTRVSKTLKGDAWHPGEDSVGFPAADTTQIAEPCITTVPAGSCSRMSRNLPSPDAWNIRAGTLKHPSPAGAIQMAGSMCTSKGATGTCGRMDKTLITTADDSHSGHGSVDAQVPGPLCKHTVGTGNRMCKPRTYDASADDWPPSCVNAVPRSPRTDGNVFIAAPLVVNPISLDGMAKPCRSIPRQDGRIGSLRASSGAVISTFNQAFGMQGHDNHSGLETILDTEANNSGLNTRYAQPMLASGVTLSPRTHVNPAWKLSSGQGSTINQQTTQASTSPLRTSSIPVPTSRVHERFHFLLGQSLSEPAPSSSISAHQDIDEHMMSSDNVDTHVPHHFTSSSAMFSSRLPSGISHQLPSTSSRAARRASTSSLPTAPISHLPALERVAKVVQPQSRSAPGSRVDSIKSQTSVTSATNAGKPMVQQFNTCTLGMPSGPSFDRSSEVAIHQQPSHPIPNRLHAGRAALTPAVHSFDLQHSKLDRPAGVNGGYSSHTNSTGMAPGSLTAHRPPGGSSPVTHSAGLRDLLGKDHTPGNGSRTPTKSPVMWRPAAVLENDQAARQALRSSCPELKISSPVSPPVVPHTAR